MNRSYSQMALVLVVILACTTFGFLGRAVTASSFTLPWGNRTPADAARKAVCGDVMPTEFEVYDTYYGEDKIPYATVVYRAECPPTKEDPDGSEFGDFMTAHRQWFSWRLLDVGNGDLPLHAYPHGLTPARPEHLLDYNIGGGEDVPTGPFAFVDVHILAPKRVAAVAAAFDNGETIRRRVGDDATATILLLPGAKAVCEVSALDSGGRVLRRYDTTLWLSPDQARACVVGPMGW